MVTERTIINALIIGASLILVPFIVSTTLSFDYGPALVMGGLILLVIAFFFIKDNLSICPLLGASISGALNFLPLPLGATHIFAIMLILYYITGYVIIRQKRIKLGKPRFLWPIVIVTLIVLYHNHSLSVKALGSTESEGAKPAVLLYLIVIAYFCGINIASPSVNFLNRVPIYCVALSALSSIPYVLTTFIPSLAPYLYYITDSVNVEAYTSTAGGVTGDVEASRFGVFGPLGCTIQLYLLCHYPIGTWWRPERWWVIGVSLIALFLAILTGYRNIMFGFIIITMAGACCYYSWRALFGIAGLAIMLVTFQLMASSGFINLPEDKLPLIAQRTLSFLPGKWDSEALQSAEDSNDFRKSIIEVYTAEYMWKSPLFGNGFTIDKKEYDGLNLLLQSRDSGHDSGYDQRYLQAKTFIEGKLFHTGWVSLYDCVGLVGGAAFVVLGLGVVLTAGHFIFGAKANSRSSLFPLYAWIFCSSVLSLTGFFVVFGDFGQTFPGFCISALVLSQLLDIEKATAVPAAIPALKGDVDFSRVGGGYYGYPSK